MARARLLMSSSKNKEAPYNNNRTFHENQKLYNKLDYIINRLNEVDRLLRRKP